MNKVSKIVNAVKQPEILATIALGGASVMAGKVLIDNYREKAVCEACCCVSDGDCDVESEDVAYDQVKSTEIKG